MTNDDRKARIYADSAIAQELAADKYRRLLALATELDLLAEIERIPRQIAELEEDAEHCRETAIRFGFDPDAF